MKRLFTWVLIISMLMTSCLALSSCDKVSEKDVEKDPQSVMNEAVEKLNDTFFADEAHMNEVCEKAQKGGSVTVSFESDAPVFHGLNAIKETVYLSEKDNRFVSDTLVKYKSDELNAKLFGDKNGLILQSPAVFGSDIAYMISFKTFREQFKDSFFKSILQNDPEVVKQLETLLASLEQSLRTMYDKNAGLTEKQVNELMKKLDMQTGKEALENADGKKEACVTVSYSFTNDTVREMANQTVQFFLDNGTMTVEEANAAKEQLESLLKEVDLHLSAKMYLNKKSAEFAKAEVIGEILDKEDNKKITLNTSFLFTEKAITLNFTMTYKEEDKDVDTLEIVAELTKEKKDGVVTYNFHTDAKFDKREVKDLLSIRYAYTLESGDFDLSLSLKNPKKWENALSDSSDKDELLKIGMKGTIKVTKDSAKFAVSNLSAKVDGVGVNLDIKLSLEWKVGVEMPAVPEAPKDLITMTDEDYKALFDNFQNSPLIKVIAGLIGGEN